MKYEFLRIDADTSKLKYKDKEFTITRNIALMYDAQTIEINAKNKMLIDLSKKGLTFDDLIIKRVENGKKYEDEKNLRAMENNYVAMASLDFFNRASEKFTSMSLDKLINDIGLVDNEGQAFMISFKEAIMGTLPSNEEKEFPREKKENQ